MGVHHFFGYTPSRRQPLGKRKGESVQNFKGTPFEKETILTCVRWYVAYPLSYYQT